MRPPDHMLALRRWRRLTSSTSPRQLAVSPLQLELWCCTESVRVPSTMHPRKVLNLFSFAAIVAAFNSDTPQFLFARSWTSHLHASRTTTTTPAAAADACPFHPPALPFPAGSVPASVTDAVAAAVSVFESPLNKAAIVPGVSYEIRYGDQVLTRAAAGVANRATGAPMAVGSLLRIGSITKAFVAVLAFKAAALGLLTLDTPILAAVPTFAVRDPFGGGGGRDITWRHLLTQRSGLQRETPPGNETADVLRALAATYLVGPVGGDPSYSNLGFALAGHLLAEAVFPGGRSLEALLNEHIFAPLQLVDTGVTYTPSVLERLAPSYDANGNIVPLEDLGWVWPAGSMYSSAQNLSSFGAALLAAASPTSPATGGPLGIPGPLARELLDVTVLLADGVSLVSAPWETSFIASYVARNKGGNVDAYSATLTLIPELALSFVALYNGGVAEGDIADGASAVLLPNLTAALALTAPPPSQGPAPGDYEGTYASQLQGVPNATVAVVGQYLMVTVPGFLNAPLDYAGPAVPDAYRVYIPPGTLTCMTAFELAIGGEYALFVRADDGRVAGVSMPGWAPGLAWAR